MKHLILIATLVISVTASAKTKTVYPFVSMGNGYNASVDNVCIDGDVLKLTSGKETWSKCVKRNRLERSECVQYREFSILGQVEFTYKVCVKRDRLADHRPCIQYKTKQGDHSLPKLVSVYEVEQPSSDERGNRTLVDTFHYTISACN